MSRLSSLVLVFTTACATSQLGAPTEPSRRTGVQLDLVPHPHDTTRTFPSVVDARIPRADRLARQIRHELGELVSLEVRLCIATAGRVESIEITRGSGLAGFDRAVVSDANGWRFEALPGPAHLRTCERARVTYRPPA